MSDPKDPNEAQGTAQAKKPAPLSIRLTENERETLLERAGTQTLSAFVKGVLFDGAPASPRYSAVNQATRTLLSHLLATLGASRIAPNLDQLAREAETVGLTNDEETKQRIAEACDDVRLMHNALMRGLGLKEKDPSEHELNARGEFNAAAKRRGN
jgi:hypothetical protein